MANVKTFGEKIADVLIEDGFVTRERLDELLEESKKAGIRLQKYLIEKSIVSEQDMSVCLGRVLNTPPINLGRISIPQEIAELVPREIARNHKPSLMVGTPSFFWGYLRKSEAGDFESLRIALVGADPGRGQSLHSVLRV